LVLNQIINQFRRSVSGGGFRNGVDIFSVNISFIERRQGNSADVVVLHRLPRQETQVTITGKSLS